jgi:hypothetical protein
MAEIAKAMRPDTMVITIGLVARIARAYIFIKQKYAETATPTLIPSIPRILKKMLMPSVMLNLVM